MFMTPLALELCRLCLVPSFGGEDERPWTAESTLASGSDMLVVCVWCGGFAEGVVVV